MMKTFEIDEYTLDILITSLKESIGVCYGVDNSSDGYESSYPYATGYSRSCMQGAVKTLESLKN